MGSNQNICITIIINISSNRNASSQPAAIVFAIFHPACCVGQSCCRTKIDKYCTFTGKCMGIFGSADNYIIVTISINITTAIYPKTKF
jgi:hypothetical protein